MLDWPPGRATRWHNAYTVRGVFMMGVTVDCKVAYDESKSASREAAPLKAGRAITSDRRTFVNPSLKFI